MKGDAGRAAFDYPASGRYGIALAPLPLVLSQELANTIGHLPEGVDLFDQVDTAQHWIDAVLPLWCAPLRAGDPRLVVTAAELPQLRALGSPAGRPHQRAGLFAAVYLVGDLSFGVPVILAGLLITPLGLTATVAGYGAAVVITAAAGLLAQSRGRLTVATETT